MVVRVREQGPREIARQTGHAPLRSPAICFFCHSFPPGVSGASTPPVLPTYCDTTFSCQLAPALSTDLSFNLLHGLATAAIIQAMGEWEDPFNVLGFVGGVVLAAALLPQIYLAHKRKSTADISYMWQASPTAVFVCVCVVCCSQLACRAYMAWHGA